MVAQQRKRTERHERRTLNDGHEGQFYAMQILHRFLKKSAQLFFISSEERRFQLILAKNFLPGQSTQRISEMSSLEGFLGNPLLPSQAMCPRLGTPRQIESHGSPPSRALRGSQISRGTRCPDRACQTRVVAPARRLSDSGGPGWGLRVCISNRLPGDADTASSGTTL